MLPIALSDSIQFNRRHTNKLMYLSIYLYGQFSWQLLLPRAALCRMQSTRTKSPTFRHDSLFVACLFPVVADSAGLRWVLLIDAAALGPFK